MEVKLKIRYVSYYCYITAVLSFVSLLFNFSLKELLFSFVSAGVFYQLGVSLIKYKRWAWWVAVVLLSLALIGSISTMIDILTRTSNVVVDGVGQVILMALFFVLIITDGVVIAVLTQKDCRDLFEIKT